MTTRVGCLLVLLVACAAALEKSNHVHHVAGKHAKKHAKKHERDADRLVGHWRNHLSAHKAAVSASERDLEEFDSKKGKAAVVGAVVGGVAGGLASLSTDSPKHAAPLTTVGGAAVGGGLGYLLGPKSKDQEEDGSQDEEADGQDEEWTTSASRPGPSDDNEDPIAYQKPSRKKPKHPIVAATTSEDDVGDDIDGGVDGDIDGDEMPAPRTPTTRARRGAVSISSDDEETVNRLYGPCARRVKEFVEVCPTIDQSQHELAAMSVFAGLQSEAMKTATLAFTQENARRAMLFSGLGADGGVPNKIARRATTRAKASLSYHCHQKDKSHPCAAKGRSENDVPMSVGEAADCPLRLATGKMDRRLGLTGRYIQLVESFSEVEDEKMFHGGSRYMGAAVAICVRAAATGKVTREAGLGGFNLNDVQAVENMVDSYRDVIAKAGKHRAAMESFYSSSVASSMDLEEELVIGNTEVFVYDEVLPDGHSRTRTTPGYTFQLSFNWAGQFYVRPEDTDSIEQLIKAADDQTMRVNGMTSAFKAVGFPPGEATDIECTVRKNALNDGASFMFDCLYYSATVRPDKVFTRLKVLKHLLKVKIKNKVYPEDDVDDDVLAVTWVTLEKRDVERVEFETKDVQVVGKTDWKPALKQFPKFYENILAFMGRTGYDEAHIATCLTGNNIGTLSRAERADIIAVDKFIDDELANTETDKAAAMFLILRRDLATENFFAYMRLATEEAKEVKTIMDKVDLDDGDARAVKEFVEDYFLRYVDVDVPVPINIAYKHRHDYAFLVYGERAPTKYMAHSKRNTFLGLVDGKIVNDAKENPKGTGFPGTGFGDAVSSAKLHATKYSTAFGAETSMTGVAFKSFAQLYVETIDAIQGEMLKLMNGKLSKVNTEAMLITSETATL